MPYKKSSVDIREAKKGDFDFVTELMHEALNPYYGGDHKAHASRIFSTHISGGKDQIGHFSFEQKMFILTLDGAPAGMIHLVGKRQGTYKISPIIVAPQYRGKRGLGAMLLEFAENYAKNNGARQMYCTVAKQNNSALQFFIRKGYTVAGRSDSHYKPGITEVMLYKLFVSSDFDEKFDRPNISVHPLEEHHEPQVRQLLLDTLPKHFRGIDSSWIDALFEGYRRRHSDDVNVKYKLIYVALDRDNTVLGVAGATPKKGKPIKVMPFIARNLPAFVALLTDIPYALKPYGRKVYVHITPSVEETIALQQRGWKLDAALPAAYHESHITQQWSFDIVGKDFMRSMRTKQRYYDLIKDGQKTLEIRVGYKNIENIQPGERIKFFTRTESIVTRVKDVRKYLTFDSMLEHEEPSRIVPGLTKYQVLSVLRKIYPAKLEKFGVVVLEIQIESER